ncbi:hypothetical protein BBW65_06330 [Helicobacter enhydrae]|uniref:Glycosyl transferase family 25 domain-containing protein n=1 Tax=Helicobacter enhydrae TaxID=222136 RepID=A0A1B1U6X0_9HELI|nr:glycosyltransferase family 25 protein [Helicobacter enhydrae]ANV98435.1 hypothetical protein BBW65_06330 [Helicobacter enhydrae]
MIKAYIINLKSATHRKEEMERQIAQIDGIEFCFFDAISYEDERFLHYRKYWDWDFFTKLYRGKALTLGEKACFSSHYALWEKCVRMQEKILVLEDDVVFSQDFAKQIQHLFEDEELNFLRLMPYFEKRSFEFKKGIRQTFDSICGTQGYILSPIAASLFLQKAKIWFCPVDNYIDKPFLHNVPNLFVVPSLITENQDMQSCIDADKMGESRKAKIPIYYKISKEFLNLLEKIWRYIYVCQNNAR